MQEFMEQKQVVNEVLSLAISELEKCEKEPVVEQAKQVLNNLIDRLNGKVKEQTQVKERKLPPILGSDKKKLTSISTSTILQNEQEVAVESSNLSVSQMLFDANVKKYKEKYGSLTAKQLKAALKKEDIAIEVMAEHLQIDISKYTGEARFEVVLQRLLNL